MPTPTPVALPSSATDIQVVEALFDAATSMDFDRVAALLAEDIVYHNVPFPPDRGKEAALRTLRLFSRVVTSFEVEMKHIASRDGVVLTERQDRLVGPLLDLDLWVCGTLVVRDQKIVLWRDYFDVGTGVAQLLTSPLRRLLRR